MLIWVQRYCIWNPSRCSCENIEYLRLTLDDSAVTRDEIINAVYSVSKMGRKIL